MTFSDLQAQHAIWSAYNFGPQPSIHSLLGIMEELGELTHAHLKAAQGIRGTPEEHRAAKADAIGDLVVFLTDYCTRENFDLDQIVTDVWSEVRRRDWKRYPVTGQRPDGEVEQ